MSTSTNFPIIEVLATFAKAREVQVYLVGGSVRDILLNRPIMDLDFALASDVIPFAKAFSDSINGTFIVMEEHPPTARIFLKKAQLNLDFAQFRGASLIDDLRLRDLTINAMAIAISAFLTPDGRNITVQSIERKKEQVVDPCGGKHALVTRQLQFPSERVILDDALRLIRIYRFAAQLDFKICHHATNLIKKYHHLLQRVTGERIRDELMKILATKQACTYLQKMSESGLLQHVIGAVEWTALEAFEARPIPKPVCHYQTEIENYLTGRLGSEVSRLSLIKLCLLLRGEIGNVSKRLRLSRKAMQFLKCLGSEHRQLTTEKLERREIIRFFRRINPDWWGVLLFSAALHKLTDSLINQIVTIYYQDFLPILKQGRLITGEDLIRIFNLKEGKEIGMLLKQLEERQFDGELRTREEAIAAAEALIHCPRLNLQRNSVQCNEQ